ncbi:MAG: 4Fe-4S dicluster domain-containing protein [Pseudomonadota bacterium]
MTTPNAILTDTTLCNGCEKCVAACKEENDLGKDVAQRWKIHIDDLSSTRFTTLIRSEGNRFVRQHCRHCLEPACVSACLVGAMKKTPEGPVVYDSEKCMGCRYCMMACPYGIPRYEWTEAVPYVRKCSMCYDRTTHGKAPACVEACPQKATLFGKRDDLLAIAHQRIQKEPDKYLNRVFGETEVGGTSVLYLSDLSLGFLGNVPALGDEPLPALTWAALSKVPPIVLGMSGLMAGAWWITSRRMKLAGEAAPEQGSHEREDSSAPAASPNPDEKIETKK